MVYSYASLGYEGVIVSIEVDMTNSIPGLEIVGLPASEVREARDRVKIAIRNSGFHWPSKRILVNLSPADIKKQGAGFDLAIALSILELTGQIKKFEVPVLALGELQFNGQVRPVPHILSAALCGVDNSISHFIVPKENQNEIHSIKGSKHHTITHLKELSDDIVYHTHNELETETHNVGENTENVVLYPSHCKSLSDLSYCDELKRVIQIVAAGRHNLYLSGAPGTGKTASAIRIPSLLPKLSYDDSLELSRIYSCGSSHNLYMQHNSKSKTPLIEERPIRIPHHTASVEAIVGSSTGVSPGEISLAHNGVLILDEAPEFKMHVLQSLREPMDSHVVHISRAGRKWSWPADFQLVLTSNLCPCGNLGKSEDSEYWCLCSEKEIFRYWKRIGGALWDRIDIKFKTKYHDTRKAEPLEHRVAHMNRISKSVCDAIEIQKIRYADTENVWNSRCSSVHIMDMCKFSSDEDNFLYKLLQKKRVSERGKLLLLRVARTIADLDGMDTVKTSHLEESFAYTQHDIHSNTNEEMTDFISL